MRILTLLLIAPSFISCQETSSNVVNIKGVNFLIPEGFERFRVDKKTDEIFKVKYKEEMYIVVQDNLSETIKKNKVGDLMAMNTVHDIKFNMIKKAYEGGEESKRKNYKINGRNITEQEFINQEHFGKAY